MPSLPSAMADQATEAAESGGGFSPLEPGVYTARLSKCEARKASTGNPMWALEFDAIRDADGEKASGRLFTNLVLIDNSMWKVGQFFEAYGVPATTDTDELSGYRVRLQVGKRVIGAGKRAGQEGNDINAFLPLQEDDEGYEALLKLQRRLSTQAAAKPSSAKKAPAKKATAPKPEAAATEAASDDEASWASDDDDGVDF